MCACLRKGSCAYFRVVIHRLQARQKIPAPAPSMAPTYGCVKSGSHSDLSGSVVAGAMSGLVATGTGPALGASSCSLGGCRGGASLSSPSEAVVLSLPGSALFRGRGGALLRAFRGTTTLLPESNRTAMPPSTVLRTTPRSPSSSPASGPVSTTSSIGFSVPPSRSSSAARSSSASKAAARSRPISTRKLSTRCCTSATAVRRAWQSWATSLEPLRETIL
mmetsp:Transcript_5581/g.16599  ORF Transcript_5581/g.16599 Transcript_5581/m.16599 type:complete len:220 (-) Transcript_5581:792-1451(-)